MAANDAVFVTGATGQQGGAVARSLLDRNQKVKVLTRDPSRAEALKRLGAEVVIGDLTDQAALVAALTGVKKAFLVTTPYQAGVDAEVKQGVTMVDAAKAAGVEHLVFTSVGSADQNTGIPHFDTKWRIEEHIRETGIPATILRPVFFMDNFGAPYMLPGIQSGKLVFPMRPDRKVQMIAVRDIGEFAVAAFLRPKDFVGQAIDLAGDELTIPEALRVVSKAMGKPIQYEPLPEAQWESVLGRDWMVMFRWFHEVGYRVNLATLQKRWGISLTRFRDFISAAPWIETGG